MKIIKKNNKEIFAFMANVSLALLEVLGLIFLFTIAFERYDGKADVANWTTFKFYTTDSNILMLVASLISIVYMLLKWNGKVKNIPQWVSIFKMTATATVTLTMFITVCFLTPLAFVSGDYPPRSLFMASNLFYHLLCPVVAILIFLLLENNKEIKLVKTLYALIPTLAYGVFYLAMAYTHQNPDGTFISGYDWYGFCRFGKVVTPFVIIGVLGFYYLFAWLLWLGNRKINIKSLA